MTYLALSRTYTLKMTQSKVTNYKIVRTDNQ